MSETTSIYLNSVTLVKIMSSINDFLHLHDGGNGGGGGSG
jgi:hypothetical protein